MPHFATFRVLLYPKPNADGLHSVYLRATFARRSKYFSLRIYCQPRDWQDTRLKKSFTGHRELNDLIRTYEQRASDYLLLIKRTGEPFTFDRFEFAVFGASEVPTLAAYCKYIASVSTMGNAEHYKSLARSVSTFRPSAMLTDLDAAWLHRYTDYLRSRAIKDTTIHFYLRTLRAACNRAAKSGIMAKDWNPFSDFSLSSLNTKTRKRAITKADIRRLEEMAGTLPVDMFLLSFYLRGINLFDLAHLTPANVQHGRIVYIRAKTGKQYSVAINRKAAAVLEYYAGGPYLLPILTGKEGNEQRRRERITRVMKQINAGIRQAFASLGIDSAGISFYTARHTYATELKRAGVPMEVISEALGHSDLKTTKIYLKEFDLDVLDQADLLLL